MDMLTLELQELFLKQKIWNLSAKQQLLISSFSTVNLKLNLKFVVSVIFFIFGSCWPQKSADKSNQDRIQMISKAIFQVKSWYIEYLLRLRQRRDI